MTQSLLNLQNAQSQHVRDRNPDSIGAAQTSGQASSCACLVKPGRWVLNPYCTVHKGLDMFDLSRRVLGSVVLVPKTPSVARREPNDWQLNQKVIWQETGKTLRERGIKRVSSNNKEWMLKCLSEFKRALFFWDPFRYSFTGEDIRFFLETYYKLQPTHVNAWGALINALVRKGLIKHNGNYVTPKDRSSHARKIKQYVRV